MTITGSLMMRVRDSNYGKNSNSRMLNQFVQHYFYLLHGKIYSKPDGTLMLALEKEHPENEALLEKLRKVADISQDVSE